MLDQLKHFGRLFASTSRDEELQVQLEKLRRRTPVPVFWLFGKTQSGKTSIIKYLTGADEAEIGRGFRPCTKTSRQYQFPTPDAPLLTFLDTRGIDEPGYDVADDLRQFDAQTHVVIVTVKAMDHAQEHILEQLRTIRRARTRPVLLALTSLHEGYPQQQHVQPYPFTAVRPAAAPSPNGNGARPGTVGAEPPGTVGVAPGVALPPALEPLMTSMTEQRRRFVGLADLAIPVDLTRPEEGYNEAAYGGAELKRVLLDMLPSAYRQALLTLDEANRELSDLYARHALPHIIGYSSMAFSAAAIPVPWVDMVIVSGIQTRMVYHLAQFYGQPLTGRRFVELASTLGLGVMMRQAARELLKVVPFVGSVASGILAAASTFALGKAFCFYYSAVQKGHVPTADELRKYYSQQLREAETLWKAQSTPAAGK